MPIEKITGGALHKFCIECGKRDVIALASLKAGKKVFDGDQNIHPDVIEMPPCPNCGAIEQMMRTTMDVPDDKHNNFAHEHKALVNRLHQHLCDEDQFDHDDVKTKYQNEGQDKKAKNVAAVLETNLRTKGMPKRLKDLIDDNNP